MEFTDEQLAGMRVRAQPIPFADPSAWPGPSSSTGCPPCASSGSPIDLPIRELVRVTLATIGEHHCGGLRLRAVNGAVLAGLFDCALGVAGTLQFPTSAAGTCELSIKFMRAVFDAPIEAFAACVKRTERLAFTESSCSRTAGCARWRAGSWRLRPIVVARKRSGRRAPFPLGARHQKNPRPVSRPGRSRGDEVRSHAKWIANRCASTLASWPKVPIRRRSAVGLRGRVLAIRRATAGTSPRPPGSRRPSSIPPARRSHLARDEQLAVQTRIRRENGTGTPRDISANACDALPVDRERLLLDHAPHISWTSTFPSACGRCLPSRAGRPRARHKIAPARHRPRARRARARFTTRSCVPMGTVSKRCAMSSG